MLRAEEKVMRATSVYSSHDCRMVLSMLGCGVERRCAELRGSRCWAGLYE